MSIPALQVFPGTYRDSLLLLSATRAMEDGRGVTWASAAMATPAAVEDLTGRGFAPGDLAGADANALVLAVRAADDGAAAEALERGRATVFTEAASPGEEPGRPAARTVGEAAARLPEANVAVVSVPGPYAAVAAHSALSAGLHVLLFSDNVPLAEEVELKERARRLGLLLMGPGAGTAVLAGVGLGFANAVTPGPVGVVAAAGTGAQEVMCLLDRWGIGVSQVIGVGGRDLSAAVGGTMACEAVRALDADPAPRSSCWSPNPPTPSVARPVIGASRATPVVAACLGMSAPDGLIGGALLAATLEQGALRAAEILGRKVPDGQDLADAVEQAAARDLSASRRRARLLHRRHPVLRGAGRPWPGARAGLLQHPAAQGPRAARARRTAARLPGPRRGGVHQGAPAPDDRPGRPTEKSCRSRRSATTSRRSCSTSSSATAHIPTRPGAIAGTCADIAAGGTAVVAYVLGARADAARARPAAPHAAGCGRDRHRERRRGGAGRGRRGGPPARPGHRGAPVTSARLPVGLVTYSVKPRGGAVHTVAPGGGAARGRVPGTGHRARRPRHRLLPSRPGAGHDHPRPAAPADPGRTGLRQRRRAGRRARPAWRPPTPILHTQDCISARAACQVRDAPATPPRQRGPPPSCAPSTTSTTSPAPRSSSASARPSWSRTGSWSSASTGGTCCAGSTAPPPRWCTTGSTAPASRSADPGLAAELRRAPGPRTGR